MPELVDGSSHPDIEHRPVGHDVGHLRPLTPLRHRVELIAEIPPAGFQHRLVRGGRCIKRNLLTHRRHCLLDLRVAITRHDENRRSPLHIVDRTACCLGALCHVRQDDLIEVGGRVERVHVKPITDLAGQRTQVRAHPRDVDGDVRVGDGAWIEEGRHERELVELALMIQRSRVLPCIPDRPHREDVVPQPRSWTPPLCAESTDDVGPDLGAEAEQELALGQSCQVPRRHGRDHRRAGKGNGDRRAQLEPGRGVGREGKGQERVVLGLG